MEEPEQITMSRYVARDLVNTELELIRHKFADLHRSLNQVHDDCRGTYGESIEPLEFDINRQARSLERSVESFMKYSILLDKQLRPDKYPEAKAVEDTN